MLQARVTFSRSQIHCYVTIYAIYCETTSNKTRVSPKHKARVNANMRLVVLCLRYTVGNFNENWSMRAKPKFCEYLPIGWDHLIPLYVWIYENGAKEFDPYHPYFTLISLNY